MNRYSNNRNIGKYKYGHNKGVMNKILIQLGISCIILVICLAIKGNIFNLNIFEENIKYIVNDNMDVDVDRYSNILQDKITEVFKSNETKGELK
ncbi:MAG TPA: hypothetical protein VLM81_01560 [Peptostreptococcaceae bacterium]|nr:hypothetical protein [Peptostreptococcaceae bacterium]